MKKSNISALIGVRGGSKRVKDKNSKRFFNSNLLSLKVKQLLRIPLIDRVVVNSEDDNLLEIAKNSGAEIVKRDAEFSTDEVLTSDYYKHIAENCESDIILSATVTTPLVQDSSYTEGIEKFLQLEGGEHDSVTSCSLLKEFLYLEGKPLNYDPSNQIRSQDLPEITSINYGYSILLRDTMIKNKNIVGKNAFFMPLNKIESIDIDTNEDFLIAESVYERVCRDIGGSVVCT